MSERANSLKTGISSLDPQAKLRKVLTVNAKA